MTNIGTYGDGKLVHGPRTYTVSLNAGGDNTTDTITLDSSLPGPAADKLLTAVEGPAYAAGTFDITATTDGQGNVSGWTWNISTSLTQGDYEVLVVIAERP